LPYTPGLILLPKTGSATDVLAADEYITLTEQKLGLAQGTVGLMPLIETAMGVENAFAIASATKRVKALFLGAEDLTADMQCKRTKEGREIEYARTRLVMAARAAGVDVYDTPFTDVNDDEGIEIDANLAKSLGFSGKASISPRHVEVINRVFSPTVAEIDYAYEVTEAIALAKQQGKGAIALRGKMIDAPIVMRAQRTIAMAEALGLGRRENV
jgi:citrate lyase subunit beta/citryl-CoA lyase